MTSSIRPALRDRRPVRAGDAGWPAASRRPARAGRAAPEPLVEGVRDLMAMPSAGDLVTYGINAPGGDVSFISEVGAHAGPSADEMQTFIIHPRNADVPAPITHPIQLYPYFVRYQETR